jgi:lipopolysaccharide export system protein LptA
MSRLRSLVMIVLCLLAPGAARAVDTTITGGRMELLNKGDKILFTGGVVLIRGNDKLTSTQMTTNKKRDKIDVAGNVRLFRRVSSTETWEATGDSGFYNTQQGSGYLIGSAQKAHVVRTEILSSTMSRVVNLYADRIDFAKAKQFATAKGGVQGKSVDPTNGDHYDFWSDQADFDGEASRITLTGEVQPLVIQTLEKGRRVIKGDKIVYFQKDQRMISEGHAEAVFEDVKEDKPATPAAGKKSKEKKQR